MIKKLLADNVGLILGAIFTLGTISTTISLLSIDVAELQEKVEELEKNKASKKEVKVLGDRVRRKLDGQLNDNSNKIHELDKWLCVLERDVEQNATELESYWQNYNRINCK